MNKQRMKSYKMKKTLRKNSLKKIEQQHEQEIRLIKKITWCSAEDCYAKGRFHCCHTTFYCSQKCQRNSWSQHHADCKRVSLLCLAYCELQ